MDWQYLSNAPPGPWQSLSDVRDAPVAATPLGDPRLERLLSIGQEMNEIQAKIQSAIKFLKEPHPKEEEEAVQLAKDELYRDLVRNSAEAKELLPVIDEIVSELEEQMKAFEGRRKVNLGLAKIEGLSGTGKQSMFEAEASDLRGKALEVQNLIGALDSLERDFLVVRRSPIQCPRCNSSKVAYRIMPSETGYSLYRCGECTNAWKVTEFRMKLGPAELV